MRRLFFLMFAVSCLAFFPQSAFAQKMPTDICARPSLGSVVPESEDLRSQNGILKVNLTVRRVSEPGKSDRFCYVAEDGSESPTLRLHPGDLLILNLKNDLADASLLGFDLYESSLPRLDGAR
jgi:hypothetical protein